MKINDFLMIFDGVLIYFYKKSFYRWKSGFYSQKMTYTRKTNYLDKELLVKLILLNKRKLVKVLLSKKSVSII